MATHQKWTVIYETTREFARRDNGARGEKWRPRAKPAARTTVRTMRGATGAPTQRRARCRRIERGPTHRAAASERNDKREESAELHGG